MKTQNNIFAILACALIPLYSNAGNDLCEQITEIVSTQEGPANVHGTTWTFNKAAPFFDFLHANKTSNSHVTVRHIIGILPLEKKPSTTFPLFNELFEQLVEKWELHNYDVTIKESSINYEKNGGQTELITHLQLCRHEAKYDSLSLEVPKLLNTQQIASGLNDLVAFLEHHPIKVNIATKFLLQRGLKRLPSKIQQEREISLKILSKNL